MGSVVRRLGLYLVAAWVSLTLNFVLPRLAPGDPASVMFARLQGRLQPEAMEALRQTFGFNQGSLLSQYGTYLAHVVRGDLGISIAYYPAPVADVIGTGLQWTVVLAGVSLLISFTAGTALGIVAAWRRGGWFDTAFPSVLVLLGAFPYFWLAMALLFAFGLGLGWFPVRHAYGASTPGFNLAFLLDVARHAVLPAGSIVIATVGGWTLAMRNNMVAVLRADFITMAWAKGLSSRTVMLRYAARSALLPSVTGFGMALGFVLGGSLLTEIVFAYPGQGFLLVTAVRNQDYPLMQGLFLMITMAVLVANFLVDMLNVWLDPRARDAA